MLQQIREERDLQQADREISLLVRLRPLRLLRACYSSSKGRWNVVGGRIRKKGWSENFEYLKKFISHNMAVYASANAENLALSAFLLCLKG